MEPSPDPGSELDSGGAGAPGAAAQLQVVPEGQCGEVIWAQTFESPTIEEQIAAQDGVAFPALPTLTTLDGEEVSGVVPKAAAFDASWGGSSADNTVARVAYTKELAEAQLTPADFLNSEYGDTTSSNEDDTCVAFNLVTNRNSLVRESGGDGENQVLQTDFPKGCLLTKECGMAARIDLDSILEDAGAPRLEDATLTYRFKFSEGFMFGRGGKLPGLCGAECVTGCDPVDGLTGWSARHMWIECLPLPWQQLLTPTTADMDCDAKFIGFPYHANKLLRCGDEFTMASPAGAVEPQAGRWYTLTSYIKMNTAGPIGEGPDFLEDGVMRTWLDGQLVLEETSMLWRQYNNITVSQFTLATFFGGSDDTWNSAQDQYIRYDDIEVKRGFCPPAEGATALPKRSPTGASDENENSTAQGFQVLEDVTVGLAATSVLTTLINVTEAQCWEACIENSEAGGGCEAAFHSAGTYHVACELLDSVAEHRLITVPEETGGSLLYSVHHRELELPPLGWNDTITGADVGPAMSCPIFFGAPIGEFAAPATEGGGLAWRKQQCGGDAAWVAANPPAPENTCRGFTFCRFFSPEVSVCERPRELVTAALDPCMRVAEGEQCGGDKEFVQQAEAESGGVCCDVGLDCVWESPTMATCQSIPEPSEEDDPFGEPFGRPRIGASGDRCGGSIEATSLSPQCGEGLFCQHQQPFFAKCISPDDDPIDFSSEPPHECGGIGTQCMGSTEWLLGLGLDGEGNNRKGVCCEDGLYCIFQQPDFGICDDPGSAGNTTDDDVTLVDTRPRTIAQNEKCGGSPFGTTNDQCVEGLFCQYQDPLFAKCVTADSTFTVHDTPEHECGGEAVQCMGDADFVAALGEGRSGVCCEDGLRCVFIKPNLGVCADPTLFIAAADSAGISEGPESSDGEATTVEDLVPVEEVVADTRPRTISRNEKCGGSAFGTTADQCVEGLFCQYQEPLFAKCVTADSTFTVHDTPEHECGGQGAKCMGDEDYIAGLGEGRSGVCCAEGLRCVFQKPFTGLCADPAQFV